MKTLTRGISVIAAATAAALVGFSGSAAAHSNVDFSLSIGVPGVVYGPAYYEAPPPPVVYVPRPVYYPPPVYYAPSYYVPHERWDGDRHRDWGRHEWRERRHGHDDDD